ncbi:MULTISPECIES: biopolymer transporter ExbD [unclassified Lentimicrobium]|mgnify:CR=1|uniref:ExbD/TolR family protein n=1 Tax=unclassified Lentimicrobium TaxID=2677434 RepID=UPI001554BDB0|nr:MULTISPECIES: biopolymer transporter ExbD [unclassified Lentimicrobium]NPD47200.1 biopolymer transporter ExbD [Lentimicrobium sp. S6]NPD84877.1 biopolymer transporter ExbD [Lentimicrobium sp. L6]
MSRFKKQGDKETPAVSTASLPDIIFMLLFFFMVTTVMRETELLVKVNPTSAKEVSKLEKKSLVSFIYIGEPVQGKLGTNTRIQLNDTFGTVDDISDFIAVEKEARDEADRKFLTTSLKVDKDTKMGIVTDVKQELRKVGAFKINYSVTEQRED